MYNNVQCVTENQRALRERTPLGSLINSVREKNMKISPLEAVST